MWYIYIFTAIILTIKITDDLTSLHTDARSMASCCYYSVRFSSRRDHHSIMDINKIE